MWVGRSPAVAGAGEVVVGARRMRSLRPQEAGALIAPDACRTRGGTVDRSGLFGDRVVGAIELYQRLFDPQLPAHCRSEAIYSRYAVQVITAQGGGMCLWLTVGRLLRCRPARRRSPDLVSLPEVE